MNHTLLAITLLGLSSNGFASSWGYEGQHGPAAWGELDKAFSLCKTGVNQSPINIQDPIKGKLPPLTFKYDSMVDSIVNNGHTIQANFAPNSTLTLAGAEFELKQVHLHAPSENTINGKHFPLEAHFVHANKQGELTVVSMMYDIGAEDKTLGKLISQFPQNSGEKNAFTGTLMGQDLLPKKKHYYRFNGSLTTPPCSEGVRWAVLKKVQTLSEPQLKAFTTLYPNNARPVQPTNARMIIK